MYIELSGYYISCGLYAFLAMLMLTNWQGRVQGALLIAVTIMLSVWSYLNAQITDVNDWLTSFTGPVELIRYLFWFVFLFSIEPPKKSYKNSTKVYKGAIAILLFGFIVTNVDFINLKDGLLARGWYYDSLISGFLLFSIIGISLTGRIYRDTTKEERGNIVYLLLVVGFMFGYDLLLYFHVLIFNGINAYFWAGRGYIAALAAPVLALAVARNPDWTLDIFVSRQMVFRSTAVLAIVIYMVIAAAIGHYLGIYGGSWSIVTQLIFLLLAAVFLSVLIFSGTIRSKAKVFINKHFFKNKYDYREEWLKIMEALSGHTNSDKLKESLLISISETMDSTGGSLWLKDNEGYKCDYSWDFFDCEETEPTDSPLVSFLKYRDWIIDLREFEQNPDLYEGLVLPEYITSRKEPWLILPVKHLDELTGYIVLARPRVERGINWEDRDLLKTVCKQAASYLALLDATEALSRAEKFAVFNKLSAFVVHDLKNLAAQLALVVSNSRRHKDNPEFIEDAFKTVDNATRKLNRMLGQLRKGVKEEGAKAVLDFTLTLREAISYCRVRDPKPILVGSEEEMLVFIDHDKLVDILTHLIQNAQEATPSDGYVRINVNKNGQKVILEIKDNGCGMNEQFLREELFRPFSTTKGNAGMGIGVYESREFVLSQGGGMKVNSKEGYGTTFTITLPLHIGSPGQVY